MWIFGLRFMERAGRMLYVKPVWFTAGFVAMLFNTLLLIANGKVQSGTRTQKRHRDVFHVIFYILSWLTDQQCGRGNYLYPHIRQHQCESALKIFSWISLNFLSLWAGSFPAWLRLHTTELKVSVFVSVVIFRRKVGVACHIKPQPYSYFL